MAQRLSNEIIAQVLTDVVTKIDKSINNFRAEMSEIKQDLTAHREATQKVLSRAISVDVKPIEEERSKLLQEVQKEKEAIKNTFKNISFVKYVVYIAIGTILVNAFLFGYFIYSASNSDADEVRSFKEYREKFPTIKNHYQEWKKNPKEIEERFKKNTQM